MTTISWKLDVSVGGGPDVATARSLVTEAYNQIEVELVDGAPEQTVELGTGSGEVQFLLVTASQYGTGLTWKLNATGNPSRALDGPLHLAGAGAIGLLGATPTGLLFTNALGSNATVKILVGRDATP